MVVIKRGNVLVLQGSVDASALDTLFAELGRAKLEIDLSDCTYLDASVLQVLVRFRPRVVATPIDPLVRRYVLPLLAQPRRPEDHE